MLMRRWILSLLALLMFTVGCEKKNEGGSPEKAKAADTAAASRAPTDAEPVDAAAAKAPEEPAGKHPGLMDVEKAAEQAPEVYRVAFETTRGDVEIEVTRAWAPRGADRFYNLVRIGFFDGAAFFRVLPGYIVQFGVSPDPAVTEVWGMASIDDDPVKESNRKGTITFAAGGKDTRTTQLFFNLDDNPKLDEMGFAPFGSITKGFEAVDSVYFEYFEEPDQTLIGEQGDAYLEKNFPKLDRITRAVIVEQ